MKNIIRSIFSGTANAKKWRVFIFILILAIGGLFIDAGAYYNRGADLLERKEIINLPRVSEIDFRLGLDLLGGAHLVYKANMEDVPSQDRNDAIEGVRDVIERRVNVFGVSEPIVQTSKQGDEYRVIVELAGVKDVSQAIAMIGETPLLEFKETSDEERELTEEETDLLNEFNGKAQAKAQELFDKIQSGDDVENVFAEYAKDNKTEGNSVSLGWVTKASHPDVINLIKDSEEKTTNKFETNYGYEILRLNEKRIKVNPFDSERVEKEIKASHILICHKESERCESEATRDEAYAKMKEIETDVTVENFEQLAKENSNEPGANSTGGDLGWFSRGMMVEPFEDTVFDNQKVGEISYIVETKFGFHLIYKQDERDIEEYTVDRILVRTLSEKDILGAQGNWKNTELTGKHLERSVVQFDPNDGSPQVSLQFDAEGAELFADITDRNLDKQVAIFLDNYIISAPTVNAKITGGQAVISGSFDIREAKQLAQRLNAGALPVKIVLISQKTVGATLGKVSIENSLKAGIIGLLLVALFMIIYYRLPGLVAVVSLIIYGILILAIFKIWPITLSLSGLAGFILSIGMAVDANILIFERLKEELKKGSPLALAIEEGFKRAWPSIRDGNISTLITCFILIQFTTSIVKGFALTLGLGVIISMFSAVVITRTLLSMIPKKVGNIKWLWR